MIDTIGPYRVYERLGVGGMGEVYKAYDDRLDRWVAIKRIRPDRLNAEDNRERFRREARATAKLNHPSIVHLYGIFEHEGADCIVMEFVEGQPLDKILADEGPLEPQRVARLGREIASGLADAHAAGILHRDLKAENIIVTPKGRAKILDFGLAKPILQSELDPILTDKGQLVGTSRSMSPEYVGGETVDHRSDLFALGVLLYETVTGRSPFRAHNTLATLKQVMLHQQTSAIDLVPSVPPEMSALIDDLLAKEPSDRPQSAQEVSAAFGRIVGSSSTSLTAPAYVPSSSSRTQVVPRERIFTASDTVLDLRPRRRWMTGLGVLVTLLVLAFLLGWYLNTRHESMPELAEGEVIEIVLGEFENKTGDQVFDAALAEAFRVGIEQSRFIRALPPSQIRETLQRMKRDPDTELTREVAIEIAVREDADRLVTGSISKFGDTFSVSAAVIDPASDENVFSVGERAKDENEILTTLDQVTREIRSYLGESASSIRESSLPLEKVTTSDLRALEAYTRGVALMESGSPEKAIQFLNRAVELDSAFAIAYARLVTIYSNRGDREKALYFVDLSQANSDRLTGEEKIYIDGWAARWRGTWSDVEEVWRLMSELYPQNSTGHQNLAFSQISYSLDYPGAVEAFRKALAVARTPAERADIQWYLGYSLLSTGNLEASRQSFETLEGDERIVAFADLELAKRNSREALRQLEDQEKTEVILKSLANVALANHRSDLAQSSFYRLYRLGGSERDRIMAITGIIAAAYQQDEALEAFNSFKEELLSFPLYPESRIPADSSLTALAAVGKMLARSSRDGQVEAEKILEIILPIPDYSPPLWVGYTKMLEAELLAAKGKAQSALDLLEPVQEDLTSAQVEESLRYFARQIESQSEPTGAMSEFEAEEVARLVVECQFDCFSRPLGMVLYQSSGISRDES